MSDVSPTGATCANPGTAVYATTYDAWGNAATRTYSGSTAALTYDLLDHLTQWNVSSSDQEQYLYDASGNRVLRRSTNSNGTTLTIYAFGLEEHQYSGDGSTNQSNTYYYFLAGHLLGSTDANGTYFYLTDALGSVLASISNPAGGAAIKANQVFGPYGNLQYHAGTMNTAKGFIGQYQDVLTGLDYFNARYYDPVVGMFLSADKTQGNLQGMDPYGYVNGNPETLSDPTGRYIVGGNGEEYHPGAPFYSDQGQEFSMQNGQPYNGPGFKNGWRLGQGPNAGQGNPKIRLLKPTKPQDLCNQACHDDRAKKGLQHSFDQEQGKLSLLLDLFSLLGDFGNIFSIKTIFLFGGVGAILQAVQTIAHALHLVGNVITFFNNGVVPSWLVPALAVIDGMSIAANTLNVLWMGSAWLLGAQGLLEGLASPEISVLALGGTLITLVAQLGVSIFQAGLDSSRAFASEVIYDWSPEKRIQYCVQQLGAANC